MSNVATVSFTPSNATDVAQLQTLAAAGKVILNGNFVYPSINPYVDFPGIQRTITIVSASNLSGVNFSIVGADLTGKPVTEVLAGPNATTVTSVNQYHIVYSVSVNGAAASFSMGSGSSGRVNYFLPDRYLDTFSVSLQAAVTGTINYSVTQTLDNVQKIASPVMFPVVAALTSATTSQLATTTNPCRALLTTINSSTGGALTITYLQQSVRG